MKIPIVFASDNGFAGVLFVALTSIIKNTGNSIYDFYILISPDFSLKNKNRIQKLVKKYSFHVVFINMETAFMEIPVPIPHITTPMFYRLLIPQLLPKEIEKCIYLDCDIIVTGDLLELYNTDLEEYYAAGVKGVNFVFNKNYESGINIPDIKNYINSGVLLLNLKLLRDDDIVNKFLTLLPNNYPCPDQDIINIACFGRIKHLPPKYNKTIRMLQFNEDSFNVWSSTEISEALSNPVIIHYLDKIKPWSDKSSPWAEEWWKYCRRTKFYAQFNRNYNKRKRALEKMTMRQFFGTIRRKAIRVLLGRELFTNLTGINQINENIMDLKNTVTANMEMISQKLSGIENDKKIVIKQIHETPAIQEVNTKTFTKYRSLYRGRDVVVIGAGPTLNYYEPVENAVQIGVNGVVLFDKIKLDYLFVQDNVVFKNVDENLVIQYPCKKFFSFVGSQPWCLPVKYRELPDVEEYCRSTFGIYNAVMHLDINMAPLADFGSVIFPAVQFALWTYPKRIYIAGCDCNVFSEGHFDGSKVLRGNNPVGDERFMYGWEKVKEFQQTYYPDVEMISINPVGLKGMFKDMYTDSYPPPNKKWVSRIEHAKASEAGRIAA
jgi:lipopolysaccharide biosynthesis glycosyltransferase